MRCIIATAIEYKTVGFQRQKETSHIPNKLPSVALIGRQWRYQSHAALIQEDTIRIWWQLRIKLVFYCTFLTRWSKISYKSYTYLQHIAQNVIVPVH